MDLKQHSVTLSEQGHEHAEELMVKAGLLAAGASLYDPANIMLMHHLYAGCARTRSTTATSTT